MSLRHEARVHAAEREAVRVCPRCGRPVKRGPKARWCSSSCKARFYLERRLTTSESQAAVETTQRVGITGPQAILWSILGELVELEARLPSGPDVSRAFGRALLAVDALRELAEADMTARRSGRSRPTTTSGRQSHAGVGMPP